MAKKRNTHPVKLTAELLAENLRFSAVECAGNLDITRDRAILERASRHPEFRSHLAVAAKVFMEALATATVRAQMPQALPAAKTYEAYLGDGTKTRVTIPDDEPEEGK